MLLSTPLCLYSRSFCQRLSFLCSSFQFACVQDGWTPLHGAACYGGQQLLEYLVAHGAAADAQNGDGDYAEELVDDDVCKRCVGQ